MENMRVLVTGATGFVGAKTVEALRHAGYGVRLFRGDVRNIVDWEKNLQDVDAVFQLAGIRTETEKDFAVNTKGAENLFTAIKNRSLLALQGETLQTLQKSFSERSSVKRIVLVSSQAVYSGNRLTYEESMQVVHPITMYGKSKYEAEKIAQKEGEQLGIDVVIFRYAAVLGSGIREKSNMSGSLARWVKAGIVGEPILVYKDPNRIRNYVHIDDVVSANLLAIDTLPSGIYNVCGDEEIRLLDLAEMIKKITGNISEVRVASVPLASGDNGDQTASNEKLKRFGWKPKKTIEEAVDAYVKAIHV